MAFGPAVDVPSDASAAAWLASALGTLWTVGGIVPPSYERHVLIEFLIEPALGWEEECELFAQLAPVLASHTTTPDRCWFAIWEGHGFDTTTTSYAAIATDDDDRRAIEARRQRLRDEDVRRNEAVRATLATLPAFDLPHRRYYLLHGPVSAASEIERPDGPFHQPPDLWWPDDRSWFVGGDVDLDWCCVGGSAPLAADVMAAIPSRTRLVSSADANASFD
jgi:hypothetical protein